jgi:TolB-like protein
VASVFLSYDREDSDRARQFAQALEKAGHAVWWDLHIKTGAQYTKEIDRALKIADAIVVLWSERSVESAWVRDEAAVGRDTGRLVPVALDRTEPPLGFRQFQTIDLSQWKGRGKPAQLRVLLDDVAAMRGPKIGIPTAEHRGEAVVGTASRSAQTVSRRTVLTAGAGAAILAAAGAAILTWQRRWFGSAGADDLSVAVLPFKNLAGDPAQGYLSEGITEDIRAALERIPALRVLGSTSSKLAAESGEGTVAIARKLGVAYLLDGSVQLAGKTLRIGVDLADGRTGFSKWSEQLDRPLADIFAVQREIAQTVASALTAQIATEKPEVGSTRSLTAYEYYLRGRQTYFSSASPSDTRAALALLNLAVAADPKFAKAHALRSRTLTTLGAESPSSSEAKSYREQGFNAARRAIELAPRLADAHVALSTARAIRLDFKGAKESIEHAVQLAPGDADVLRNYADQVLAFGEVEAAREAATKSVALDPLNPRAHSMLADVEYGAARYRTAIDHFETALSLSPKSPFNHAKLAFCLMFLGEVQEALKEGEKEPAPFMRQMALAIIRHKLGDRAGAAREFEQLKKTGPLVSYQVALVLAQWGDTEGALSALRTAVQVRDAGITSAKMDPLLVPLHGNPSYTALLRQLNLV